MCGKSTTATAVGGDEALRVARGAAALDAVYGTKWFRTENVSLGELVDLTHRFDRIFGTLEGLDYPWRPFTAKLREAQSVPRSLMLTSDEINGEKFGFYGGDRDALLEAWKNEIRTRRYNRPAKRRVSSATARVSRTTGGARVSA